MNQTQTQLEQVQTTADQALALSSIDARFIRIIEILQDERYTFLSPEERTEIAKVIIQQATLYESVGMTPALLMGIIQQESGFNPRAKSEKDAYGLMQLIVPTAQPILKEMGYSQVTEEILTDIEVNITAGAKYLVRLHAYYVGKGIEGIDDYSFSIHSYFWGPGNTAQLINAGVDQRVMVPSLTYSVQVLQKVNYFKESESLD